MKTFIQVIRYKDKEVVKSLDVTGKTERQQDQVDRGLNMNLNHDEYFTRFLEE